MSESLNYGMLQSAYRAFHLMATAMTKVVNDLLTASDSGHPSVLLSLEWTLAQLSTCSTMIACLRIWSQQSSSRLAELIPVRSQHLYTCHWPDVALPLHTVQQAFLGVRC